MPLFFFRLNTPDGLEPLSDGVILPDLETAYLEACKAIPDLSAEYMAERVNPLTYSFVISGEAGEALMDVPFDEAFQKCRRPVPPHAHDRTRRLSEDIADAIEKAQETTRQSLAILARSNALC